MAEDKKKNNILRFVKKQMSQNISNNLPVDNDLVDNNDTELRARKPAPAVRRTQSIQMSIQDKHKRSSIGAVNELISCPLCAEKFNKPKMLLCQHTFCADCLRSKIKDNVLTCPTCKVNFPITSKDYIEKLPSNLYVDIFLKQIGNSPPNESMLARVYEDSMEQMRCCQCKSMVDMNRKQLCEHCKQTFCAVCWPAHITELKSQISSLLNELKSASKRLNHRLDSYKDRNEWLVNQIVTTAEKKIVEIKEKKIHLVKEAAIILEQGEASVKLIDENLNKLQLTVTNYVTKDYDVKKTDNEKVSAFMNFHQMAVGLLNDVTNWGESKYSLDQDKFCIENDTEGPEDVENDEPVIVEVRGVENPLENPAKMVLYYRSRNFMPRMIWKKCPRPAGVGIAPWSDNLFICSTDSQTVIVMDKLKGKIIERFSDAKMLCPQGIAFSQRREEIFVSDKWAHCIHVLSKTGNYLRTIGSKGSKEGFLRSPEGIAIEPNENYLYVCDTGNDRIQVFHLETGAFVHFVGVYSPINGDKNLQITQLNGPTGVAAIKDRIIIADSGNKRIKTFSYKGEKLKEFGSQGFHKGQFLHPEVFAVDPLGFILVGDCGNSRIQIFEPNGQLLRVFGKRGREPGQFGWISGMYMTQQLELIVCDTKNHHINIF